MSPSLKGAVIDLLEQLPKIANDTTESALSRIWNDLRHARYVEKTIWMQEIFLLSA